jgi:hypothetical protein
MNTIVRFRLRQVGGDLRWQDPKVYQPDETAHYPDIGQTVFPPESIGGECIVTEITEVIGQEAGDGPKVIFITVILRRPEQMPSSGRPAASASESEPS